MAKIGYACFIGEFGWEVMTWQAYLRKMSHDYDHMIVSSFEGMEPLYRDFHCAVDFIPHQHPGRALDWKDISMVEKPDFSQYTSPVETIEPVKKYRLEGEFVRYGTPKETEIEVLFHARAVSRSTFKNYPADKWKTLAETFQKAASVGSLEDLLVQGTQDKRGLPLHELMDLMASAKVIIGGSSGVMHLATVCGLRQVVWADNKTYFSEPLERRYKETWNPFRTPVSWVETDAWNPEPDEIIAAAIGGGSGSPTTGILTKLGAAVESGQYFISIAHIGKRDGKETVETSCETVNFPNDRLQKAIEQITANMDELVPAKEDEEKAKGGTAWR